MQKLLLKLILVYKHFISPLLPKCCRFYPTCSQYAYEAIKNKGAARGFLYALVRLFKCHPFHAGGYDPVDSADKSVYKIVR